MSDKMVGKITFGGVEFQTPILDVPRDSAERDAMERYYSLGFKAGAEAMREAAAKTCGDLASRSAVVWHDETNPHAQAAKAIRALPLPEIEK